MSVERFLIGDVGGTNTRLQLHEWDPQRDTEVLLADKTYHSKNYSSLTDALREFLTTYSKDKLPVSCCLALAGPVHANSCVITNLDWHINGSDIEQALHIPHVAIINDFVAAGYGCISLPPSSLIPIYSPPSPSPSSSSSTGDRGVKSVIGAGTGLGEAFAVYNSASQQYEMYPTEGGHADFSAGSEEEWRVAEHIMRRLRLDHCSVERLVSGTGIANIYHALRDIHPHLVNPLLDAQILKGDVAANVSMHAEQRTDALCVKAVALFIQLYGAESGNFALKTLPMGGVYIAGGVAGKILWAMRDGAWQRAFVSKGRLRHVLQSIPVWAVQGEVGLLGTKAVAIRLIKQHRQSGVRATLAAGGASHHSGTDGKSVVQEAVGEVVGGAKELVNKIKSKL